MPLHVPSYKWWMCTCSLSLLPWPEPFSLLQDVLYSGTGTSGARYRWCWPPLVWGLPERLLVWWLQCPSMAAQDSENKCSWGTESSSLEPVALSQAGLTKQCHWSLSVPTWLSFQECQPKVSVQVAKDSYGWLQYKIIGWFKMLLDCVCMCFVCVLCVYVLCVCRYKRWYECVHRCVGARDWCWVTSSILYFILLIWDLPLALEFADSAGLSSGICLSPPSFSWGNRCVLPCLTF